MEAHPGAMEAHHGAMEAHSGAMKAHSGGLCVKNHRQLICIVLGHNVPGIPLQIKKI